MNLPPIHRQRRVRSARRGMVLLEVIVALTVFTMVAFALVMALNSSFDAALERNEIDVALCGLKNQLSLLHEAQVAPGETDAPDDGSGVLYHVSIAQAQMQDQKNLPVANMYRATITATWKSRGQDQERDVTELIYQP